MKLHKTQTIVVEEDRAHKYCQAFVNPGSKDKIYLFLLRYYMNIRCKDHLPI